MKKILFVLFGCLSIIVLYSCEENFNPKLNFSEKYVLYSIINIDSLKQTAVLLKSYDVEGFDPYTNTSSTFISGADIIIRQNDRVFFMRDTSAYIEGVSRYNDSINFYYLNNFVSTSNDSIDIVATLKDGKKLFASALPPARIQFDTQSDKILPPLEKNIFSFIWSTPSSSIWYLPKLEFFYTKGSVTYGKLIPIKYEIVNGKSKPVYPVISNNNFVNFTVSALDSVFRQIAEGDPNKSSYKILAAKLSLLVFNESLSNYYSTTNGFLDDFTVILDESDYTNIKGGFGVLGIYRQQQTGAFFTEEYIQSFGYTPGIN